MIIDNCCGLNIFSERCSLNYRLDGSYVLNAGVAQNADVLCYLLAIGGVQQNYADWCKW